MFAKNEKLNEKMKNDIGTAFLLCYSVAYICSCCLVSSDAFGFSFLSSACLLSVLLTKACRIRSSLV